MFTIVTVSLREKINTSFHHLLVLSEFIGNILMHFNCFSDGANLLKKYYTLKTVFDALWKMMQ